MRRRFVWIQGKPQEEALYFLYYAPDGYYAMKSTGETHFIAPYVDTDNPYGIFDLGFTTVSDTDWRFCTQGPLASGGIINQVRISFYGTSGRVNTAINTNDDIAGTGTGSGLITNVLWLDDLASTRQMFWYSHLGTSGNGANTYPAFPPNFILPDVTLSYGSIGDYRVNADMSWAVGPTELVKADGTKIAITSGAPSPWPDYTECSFVGLTLFVHSFPDANTVNSTPYVYDPDTGTATAGTPFSIAVANPPDPGWSWGYLSYWTPNA